MCRLVSYSYSRKGGREGEGKASFRSVARSYCPLATLPLFGEEPRHYFGVVWTNNCLACRYVLRADSRIVVFTVLGFRGSSACFHPILPKEMREFGKCVFFFFLDIFETILFSILFDDEMKLKRVKFLTSVLFSRLDLIFEIKEEKSRAIYF